MWRVWRGGLAGRWRENSPPKPPPRAPPRALPRQTADPRDKEFQKKKKRQDFHKMQFSQAKLMKTTVFWSFSSVSLGKTEVCENAVVFFLGGGGNSLSLGSAACPVLSCPVLSVCLSPCLSLSLYLSISASQTSPQSPPPKPPQEPCPKHSPLLGKGWVAPGLNKINQKRLILVLSVN